MRFGRGVATLLMPMLMLGCAYDTSFKSITLDGVDRDPLFDACEKVVIDQYKGVKIRVDREGGRIETDPVEFSVTDGARREQAYLVVKELAERRFRVEVMAPLSEMVVDLSADPPVEWVLKGSDVKQEHEMLDLVLAEVLLRFPEATLVEEG